MFSKIQLALCGQYFRLNGKLQFNVKLNNQIRTTI
jgi:hypothetical protein